MEIQKDLNGLFRACSFAKNGKVVFLTKGHETAKEAEKAFYDRFKDDRQPCRITVAGDYRDNSHAGWTILLDGKELNFVHGLDLKVDAKGKCECFLQFALPMDLELTGTEPKFSEIDLENMIDLVRHSGYVVEKVE